MSNLPVALIFDVDGTMADTERDGHRVAYNNIFEDFGLDWYCAVKLRRLLFSQPHVEA